MNQLDIAIGSKPVSERQIAHFPLTFGSYILYRKFKSVCMFVVKEEVKLYKGTKESHERWEGQDKDGSRSARLAVGDEDQYTRCICMKRSQRSWWLGYWLSKWE